MVKLYKTLNQKVKNFVHLDRNESLFSCKVYCFCAIGLCKVKHSSKLKMYQLSTAMSLIALATFFICNPFIGLKEKSFMEILYDCEFVVYIVFILLKMVLLFVKKREIERLIKTLNSKVFGWDKEEYLEIRRINYSRNTYFLIIFVMFEICGVLFFFAFPLFDLIPIDIVANPVFFWVIYLLSCSVIIHVVLIMTHVNHLAGCLFSFLSNEFVILGRSYERVFDGLEDNIDNDSQELVDEIEKTLNENAVQHQKLIK